MFNDESIIEIFKEGVKKNIPSIVGKDIYVLAKFANKYMETLCCMDKEFTEPIPGFDIDPYVGLKMIAFRDSLQQNASSWNRIEIHFDKDLNAQANFIWDQAYYDEDIEENKKLKKKK